MSSHIQQRQNAPRIQVHKDVKIEEYLIKHQYFFRLQILINEGYEATNDTEYCNKFFGHVSNLRFGNIPVP